MHKVDFVCASSLQAARQALLWRTNLILNDI